MAGLVLSLLEVCLYVLLNVLPLILMSLELTNAQTMMLLLETDVIQIV